MAICFLGPRPKHYDVHHKDGDKLHNYLDNIEYRTRSENVEHAWNTGLIKRRMFTEEEIFDIKERYKNGCSDISSARKYKVSDATIRRLISGERNFLKRVM